MCGSCWAGLQGAQVPGTCMMLRAACPVPELMALHLRSREEGCCIPQSSAAWKMSLQFKKKLSKLKKKKSVWLYIYLYTDIHSIMREQHPARMFVRKQNKLKGSIAQWGPDRGGTFPPRSTIEIKSCQEYKDIVKRRHQRHISSFYFWLSPWVFIVFISF